MRGSLERIVTTPGGKFSVHEAFEIAAGNDAVITGIMSRQTGDITADVGAAQASGEGGTVDRARAQGAGESRGHPARDHGERAHRRRRMQTTRHGTRCSAWRT